MTVQRGTRFALATAGFLALPAAAHAQTGQPAPATPAAPAQQPAADEASQLRQRISQLQQRALADPSLKGAQDSLNTVVQQAMACLDPTAPTKSARATALTAEVAAARAASDNAKLNQLAEEATQLQSYFAGLTPRAMQDPQVQTARQAFLARVLERMKAIDPNAQQYVDRLSELQRQP